MIGASRLDPKNYVKSNTPAHLLHRLDPSYRPLNKKRALSLDPSKKIQE